MKRTKEENEKINIQLLERFNEKYTLAELCKEFGIYNDQVRRVFENKFGKEAYQQWLINSQLYKKKNPNWGHEAEKLFKEGIPVKEIIQKLGKNETNVINYLKEVFTPEVYYQRWQDGKSKNYPSKRNKRTKQEKVCLKCSEPILTLNIKNIYCNDCYKIVYPIVCPICNDFRCENQSGLIMHFNNKIYLGCEKHKMFRKKQEKINKK